MKGGEREEVMDERGERGRRQWRKGGDRGRR